MYIYIYIVSQLWMTLKEQIVMKHYYGVATISRLLKTIGLFCRILSVL